MGKPPNRLAAIVLLALLAASANARGQERLRLAYSAISGSMLTPWVAAETGIFKNNNLAVELVYIAAGTIKDFVDLRWVEELERSGFIAKLYRR